MSRSLLLDTHILLWLRGHSGLLSDGEQRLIDQSSVRYVSAVSLARADDLVLLTRDTRIIGYGAAGATCASAQ